jgi:hypothetical protein
VKSILKYFCWAFVAFVLVSNVVGCKALHPTATTTSKTVESDSTNTKVTERFVIVEVPGDTIMLEHWVECPEYDFAEIQRMRADGATSLPALTKPKPFKQKVKGQRSDGAIEINDMGRLTAIFNCNQWRDSVKVKDTEIARLKSFHKIDSTRIEIPVRYIPKAYKASMWFSSIVIGLLVLWLLWQAVRLYMKLKPF